MAIEHFGPPPVTGMLRDRLPQQDRVGWNEMDEMPPCGTCGELLIQEFSEQFYAGQADPVRYTSQEVYCRNGCSFGMVQI